MRRDFCKKIIFLFCILSARRANVFTSLIYLWAVPYSNCESLMTHWIRIYFQQRCKYSIWWISRSPISAETSSFTTALSLPSSSASLSCAVATYSAEAPPRMHQNSPFSDKKAKNFQTSPPVGRGTLPPHALPPRRFRRLDSARAYGAQSRLTLKPWLRPWVASVRLLSGCQMKTYRWWWKTRHCRRCLQPQPNQPAGARNPSGDNLASVLAQLKTPLFPHYTIYYQPSAKV